MDDLPEADFLPGITSVLPVIRKESAGPGGSMRQENPLIPAGVRVHAARLICRTLFVLRVPARRRRRLQRVSG